MTEPIFVQFSTLLALAILTPAFVLIALAMFHRDVPFWRIATASYLAILVGSTFGAFRSHLPEFVTILASNTLIAAGYYLAPRALRTIKQQWGLSYIDAILPLLFLAV